MSYARPTLISQIVRRRRKVSINPRNEDEAAPEGGEGELSELFFPVQRERRRERESRGVEKNDVAKNRGGAKSRLPGIFSREYIRVPCEF